MKYLGLWSPGLHFPDFLVYSQKYLEPNQESMLELFLRKLLSVFAKKCIIDVSPDSKHVSDTFVNFIVICGLLHITLDFYMTSTMC